MIQLSQSETFKNITEQLVIEEIKKQTKKLAPSVVKNLNLVDVATYALNRLPPLYASSSEGEKWQRRRAQETLEQEITAIVRRAIASIEKDPIRLSTPLEKNSEDKAVLAAFENLRSFLQDFVNVDELSTDEVVSITKQTIVRAVESHKLGTPANLGKAYYRQFRARRKAKNVEGFTENSM